MSDKLWYEKFPTSWIIGFLYVAVRVWIVIAWAICWVRDRFVRKPKDKQ